MQELSHHHHLRLPKTLFLTSLAYTHNNTHTTKTMKQSSCFSVLLLLFLIASQTPARSLLVTTNQGSKEQQNNLNMKGGESLEELMGMEECKNGDEECLKRRAITEVHLDYIYTQHHKP